MKKKHFAGLGIAGLMVALVAFMLPTAQAVTGDISSTVVIECPVELNTNGGSLDFGYLSAPSSGYDWWTVSAASPGPLVQTGTGDGHDFIPDDHSRGDFVLTGSEPIYFTVVVTTDFPTDDLNLLEPLLLSEVSGVDPSPGDPGCADLTVFVGGTLEVYPDAPTGFQSATITITANY